MWAIYYCTFMKVMYSVTYESCRLIVDLNMKLVILSLWSRDIVDNLKGTTTSQKVSISKQKYR